MTAHMVVNCQMKWMNQLEHLPLGEDMNQLGTTQPQRKRIWLTEVRRSHLLDWFCWYIFKCLWSTKWKIIHYIIIIYIYIDIYIDILTWWICMMVCIYKTYQWTCVVKKRSELSEKPVAFQMASPLGPVWQEALFFLCLAGTVENSEGSQRISNKILPGTLNNHFLMDVWWNNHFYM